MIKVKLRNNYSKIKQPQVKKLYGKFQEFNQVILISLIDFLDDLKGSNTFTFANDVKQNKGNTAKNVIE
jgi:hypothetical protein